MKKLLIAVFLILATSPAFGAVELDADSNGATDIGKGGTNATTEAGARTSLGVPATAATLAGSCTVGPCLDGTSDGGDLIKLYGPGGFWTSLQAGNAAANRNWRLPIDAPPTAGTTRLINVDENTQMGLVDPASLTAVTATGFDGNLAVTDDTLQEVAQKLDDLSVTGGYTNLTSFLTQTAWRVFYSDGSGDVKELALGADGEYLKSNGAAAAPTWATPAGSGDMVLATAQTVTGKKTFENSDLALLGSSTGATTFASANASATDYISTFPASTGTVAYISDTAYDATSWNSVTDTAPTKNAVRDALEALPSLTIQTTAITTGANNILGSDYGLIADTDGDGLPNKVDLAAAGTVQVDSNGVVSSVAFASSSDINTGTDTTKPVTADALSGSNLGIEPVGWMIKNSATATAVADGTEAFVVPAAMNGRNLVDVTAATASPNGGTGGSTTVVIRRVRTTAAMGDATSQYDLTFSTPNVTITWDGTGTDPGIVNTAASLQAGDEVDITGFATAANNGHWTIATVGTNYITFANAAGVENLDDIGVTITPTKHRDMTSTGATVAYTEYSASDETVDTGYDDIATGDRIYVDVTGITTTAGAKGLSVTSSFQLP